VAAIVQRNKPRNRENLHGGGNAKVSSDPVPPKYTQALGLTHMPTLKFGDCGYEAFGRNYNRTRDETSEAPLSLDPIDLRIELATLAKEKRDEFEELLQVVRLQLHVLQDAPNNGNWMDRIVKGQQVREYEVGYNKYRYIYNRAVHWDWIEDDGLALLGEHHQRNIFLLTMDWNVEINKEDTYTWVQLVHRPSYPRTLYLINNMNQSHFEYCVPTCLTCGKLHTHDKPTMSHCHVCFCEGATSQTFNAGYLHASCVGTGNPTCVHCRANRTPTQRLAAIKKQHPPPRATKKTRKRKPKRKNPSEQRTLWTQKMHRYAKQLFEHGNKSWWDQRPLQKHDYQLMPFNYFI
jgi:hypothetical protein